ncbi:MAG TPA: hypothetical protein VF194_06280 [Ferrovibrio sp.]|uniref:hypothetical protein n=1 Tax=Ferrovibrio sp. TaxID=1917215 RepID=UPI002ED01F41
MAQFQTERMTPTLTRVRCGGRLFGQIKRQGREWHAEIRRTDDGALVRHAGIWGRKADAIDEVEFILQRES